YERVSGRQFFDLQAATTRAAGQFDPAGNPLLVEVAALRQRFHEGMDDDFNTGAATAVLFELLTVLNKFVDVEKLEAGKPDAGNVATLERGGLVLKELAGVLGLFRKPVELKTGGDDALVAQLVQFATELRTAGKASGQDSGASADAQLDTLVPWFIDVR